MRICACYFRLRQERQHRRILTDTPCEVTVKFMERRTLTDAAIDQVGQLGVILWKDIGLSGDKQGCRRVGKLTQNRLTRDDNDFAFVCYCTCRTNGDAACLYRFCNNCITSQASPFKPPSTAHGVCGYEQILPRYPP